MVTLLLFLTRYPDCLTWLSLWPDQPGRCATDAIVWVHYWTALPL